MIKALPMKSRERLLCEKDWLYLAYSTVVTPGIAQYRMAPPAGVQMSIGERFFGRFPNFAAQAGICIGIISRRYLIFCGNMVYFL